MAMTKEQALALAGIIVPALQTHASTILNEMTDAHRAAAHPEALAALGTLANIEGTFCEIEPKVNKVINTLGLIARYFLGAAVAILLTFQAVLKEIAAAICPPVTAAH